LDILPVKKEAKLSASEMPGEVVGSGEEDLRCRSLLTVCQRRLGLSEAEYTRLEKYSYIERQRRAPGSSSAAARGRSTALSSKCGQCHVDSRINKAENRLGLLSILGLLKF